MDGHSLAVGIILGVALGVIATACIAGGITAVMLRQMRVHDSLPPARPAPSSRPSVDGVFRPEQR